MEKRVWKALGSFAKLFEEKFFSSEKTAMAFPCPENRETLPRYYQLIVCLCSFFQVD